MLAFISASSLAQNSKKVTVYDSPDHSEWHQADCSVNSVNAVTDVVVDSVGLYPELPWNQRQAYPADSPEHDSASKASRDYLFDLRDMFIQESYPAKSSE